MGFSHLGFCVPQSKLEEVVSFYLSALAPLGYKELIRPAPHVVGLGVQYPDFWITGAPESSAPEPSTPGTLSVAPLHIAFDADDQAAVGKFHEEALKAGGTCNGPPGPRPQYGPTYYGAFIVDPVGNNIEATFMKFE